MTLGVVLWLALALTLLAANRLFRPPPALPGPSTFKLWLAQGLGVGRIPWAPGTFGSALGLGWFALLLACGQTAVLVLGTLAGVGLSVWLCGAGERILAHKDPGSVVLDEIAAIPLCFLTWVALLEHHSGALPTAGFFFSAGTWPLTLGVFAAFRFFDVVKPWPVRQSQALPGGWGITIDDLLAALYVNGVTGLVYAARVYLLK